MFQKFVETIENANLPNSIHIAEAMYKVSGYYKLRKHIENVKKIELLIGIDTNDIYTRYRKRTIFLAGSEIEEESKAIYEESFIEEIKSTKYYSEIENGILQLYKDMKDEKVELRIFPSGRLGLNFCLLLPKELIDYKVDKNAECGHLLIGSSRISNPFSSDTFFDIPKIDFNCIAKEYEDIFFFREQFNKLWKKSLPIKPNEFETLLSKTHLGQTPTPHELYLKLLIDNFQEQIGEDFADSLPNGFKNLKYQADAVSQGYDLLLKHNGYFLADVVGLGKTVVAAMTARRFIEENGVRKSKILVIFPPALESNWRDTFQKFGIDRYTDFITNGSLEKVMNNRDEYDLILIDEVHRFRNDTSSMYDKLQRVCKAKRKNAGGVKGSVKKVILISATPLNNRPDDLYNLLRLFQDVRNPTLSGIPNLQKYFAPKIKLYKEMMKEQEEEQGTTTIAKRVNALYDEIRREVIDQITVRRTRENILNNPDYKADIEAQNIKFPVIECPREVSYMLDIDLKNLFEYTMLSLTERLFYARYRAIERLQEPYNSKYANAEIISRSLAAIYRTHMVKRLESSFDALRISLSNLLQATQIMITMFENDKVIIAPELKINKLRGEGWSFDEIIERGIEQFGVEEETFVYPSTAFNAEFITELRKDEQLLKELIQEWGAVRTDPKLDKFIELLGKKIFAKRENPTGKLVIFSESRDTIKYLERELKERLQRDDILAVSSTERNKLFTVVQENFDANYSKRCNDYNIIITTDVLAEGINLHRSNVIVNYDTPWNAIRLMQRIGRVNRIGSVADSILNYLFYPSAEGDAQIRLYKNALAKLQGFHSAYGEDSQIYSREEIVQHFELFNPNIGDDEDKRGMLLREIRDFFKTDPQEYARIKNLPCKSRLIRNTKEHKGVTLVCISSNYKVGYYLIHREVIQELSFLEMARLMKADDSERSLSTPQKFYNANDYAKGELTKFLNPNQESDREMYEKLCAEIDGYHKHYIGVDKALLHYTNEVADKVDSTTIKAGDSDPKAAIANKFIRSIWRSASDPQMKGQCDILSEYIELGTYTQLTRDVLKLREQYNCATIEKDEVAMAFVELVKKYHNHTETECDTNFESTYSTPYIVFSETFL